MSKARIKYPRGDSMKWTPNILKMEWRELKGFSFKDKWELYYKVITKEGLVEFVTYRKNERCGGSLIPFLNDRFSYSIQDVLFVDNATYRRIDFKWIRTEINVTTIGETK